MKAHVTVCALYYNEATYLEEWIEFHRLVGVERFFLYDNLSDDGDRRVLQPYIRKGLVVVHDWPIVGFQQTRAYESCLHEHRDDAQWIAFIDIDEFMFSPTHRPVGEVLREFEAHPGVCIGRREFTYSGHLERPSAPVIESYVRVLPPPHGVGNSFKSVINPSRTTKCVTPHVFAYEGGAPAVDDEARPVERPYSKRSFPTDLLCLNHYFTKSAQERRSRPGVTSMGWRRPPPGRGFERRWAHREQKTYRDERILHYAPALRAALGREASRSSPAP